MHKSFQLWDYVCLIDFLRRQTPIVNQCECVRVCVRAPVCVKEGGGGGACARARVCVCARARMRGCLHLLVSVCVWTLLTCAWVFLVFTDMVHREADQWQLLLCMNRRQDAQTVSIFKWLANCLWQTPLGFPCGVAVSVSVGHRLLRTAPLFSRSYAVAVTGSVL